MSTFFNWRYSLDRKVFNRRESWQLVYIYFLQGSPEYLTSYACDNYFEWNTVAACKSKGSVTSDITAAESICYTFDKQGRKRDLSMLIKLTDAYSVMTDDGSTMYINVCRDISAGILSNICTTSRMLELYFEHLLLCFAS